MAGKSGFRTELLTTVEELKDFCRDHDIVMGQKRKAQLVAAIRSEGLWQAFCKTVECEGCEIYEPKCRCTAIVVELREELRRAEVEMEGLRERLHTAQRFAQDLNASNAIIVRTKTDVSRGTMMAVLEELNQNKDLTSHFIDEDGTTIR
jgi:hypothetical protein